MGASLTILKEILVSKQGALGSNWRHRLLRTIGLIMMGRRMLGIKFPYFVSALLVLIFVFILIVFGSAYIGGSDYEITKGYSYANNSGHEKLIIKENKI